MRFIKVKTRAFLPPKDNIYDLFEKHLPKLKEGDVLFITSKVLAIHQGRCIKIGEIEKDKLIKKEAERIIDRKFVPHGRVILTIKNNTLIPTAGIDESNANGYYALWPKNIQKLAKEIWFKLKRANKIKNFGVVVTDSHTIPMRFGTVGISIGFYGIEPLKDYRKTPDIFGRPLKITRANILDALTSTAVVIMGEGNEQTPMIILRDFGMFKFTTKNAYKNLIIPKGEDLYTPLLKVFKKCS